MGHNRRSKGVLIYFLVFLVLMSLASLLFGMLGELLDYRVTMTIIACISMLACWLTVGRHNKELDKIYLYQSENEK